MESKTLHTASKEVLVQRGEKKEKRNRFYDLSEDVAKLTAEQLKEVIIFCSLKGFLPSDAKTEYLRLLDSLYQL